MLRVAIADDHPDMRVALRLLLSLSKATEIVCATSNAEDALDCVRSFGRDVLVMDIQMPGLDGLEATKQIVELAVPTRVVLISIFRGSYLVRQAKAAGAKGFVPKDDVARHLIQVVETVSRGEEMFIE
jgi:DNA-binding NarL/FixJ family response regulator